jgi:hypothetical protein
VTFSAMLDRTVQLYRPRFGPLLAIAAAGALLQLPFVLAIDPGKQQPPPDASLREILSTSLGTSPTNLLMLGLLSSLVVTIVYGALTRAVLAAHEGRPIDVGEAFRASFARLPTLIGTGLLALLATFVGLILLVIPAIYIALGFSFSYLVVMAEGAGAWLALRRSWTLARNLRWPIFGLLMVWALLQMVVSYAVGGAMALVGLGGNASRIAGHLASAVIMPCYVLSLCLVYFDARATKEGHDLALEAQRMAGAAAGGAGSGRAP